jgi:hypothetical protein
VLAKRQGEEKGHRDGRVGSLREGSLILLEARGLSVSDKVRADIAAQTDPAILAAWLARCATARSAEEAVA